MVVRSISLFSGYGGLDLALAGIASPALYVEREAYAAANLVALMQAGKLDQAPIWSDVRTLDASRWRSKVRLITAGFPCQPHSAAGRHAGTDDERFGLFHHILRIARNAGQPTLFLENVPGILAKGRGFDTVLGALAESGYDAVWTCLSAADTGATHRRNRLFVLAHPRNKRYWTPEKEILARREAALDGRGWTVEPDVARVGHGGADRVDRIRLLANGVCPAQARAAFLSLIKITSTP